MPVVKAFLDKNNNANVKCSQCDREKTLTSSQIKDFGKEIYLCAECLVKMSKDVSQESINNMVLNKI